MMRSGREATMKAQDFKALVEQLGDLSEVQRAALAAALAGKGSANEAIALIETRFAAEPACGHCKSQRFGGWGKASGLKAIQMPAQALSGPNKAGDAVELGEVED